ncbi:hypothetical protein ACS0TY_007156 [Phlomoides rotata]
MVTQKRYITVEELKTHNKEGDLWISIQGKVYDVSEWVKHHPDGDLPLINLAGEDATDAFEVYHPGTAWQFLDKFFNGFHFNGGGRRWWRCSKMNSGCCLCVFVLGV